MHTNFSDEKKFETFCKPGKVKRYNDGKLYCNSLITYTRKVSFERVLVDILNIEASPLSTCELSNINPDVTNYWTNKDTVQYRNNECAFKEK